MMINGKNYLLLERRGCEFWPGEPENKESDIGNYRVCTPWEMIPGKDGNTYFLEFGMWKRQEGKKAATTYQLHLDTQYTGSDGYSLRNLNMEKPYNGNPKPYTTASILEIVNAISADHYDAIKWVYTFEARRPHGANWTPASLIYEWAKANRLQIADNYGTKEVTLYSGTYKYLCYSIRPASADTDTIRVILEKI